MTNAPLFSAAEETWAKSLWILGLESCRQASSETAWHGRRLQAKPLQAASGPEQGGRLRGDAVPIASRAVKERPDQG